MGRSVGISLLGLTLVIGCAAGTEEMTNHTIGNGDPNGASFTDDSGASSPPPSGSNGAPGSSSFEGGSGGGFYEGGSAFEGGGGYEGGAAYEAGGYSSEGGYGYDAGSTGLCMGYAPPTVSAGCTACTSTCQANGCYGGYWCDTATNKCHSNPPSGC